MGKVILKTALITIASILLALSVFYIGVGVFAPYKLADFYTEAGWEKTAFKYREKAYQMDKSQKKLEKVIFCAIENNDDKNIIKYVELYVDGINNNKLEKDEGVYIYITGSMCRSLLKSEGKSVAIERAVTFLHGKYPEHNQMQAIIAYAIESKDNFLLNDIYTRLKKYSVDAKSTLEDPNNKTDLARLASDIAWFENNVIKG